MKIGAGLFAMTERSLIPKSDRVLCPTCRQHTDFGNIALADDRRKGSCYAYDKSEASITVQGSYSTKVTVICN